MTLDRYNRIAIAIISTSLLLALLALGVFLGITAFTKHETNGIVIDHEGRPKQKQVLVTCLPSFVPSSEYEYFPVAAVVARDASEVPIISPMAVSLKDYGSGRFAEGCRLGEYGSSGRIFNVVVKNTSTGEERFLLKESAQVMSLVRPSDKCADGEGDVPCRTLLWTIRTTDSNKDGIIDGHDAEVEFVSDLAATNLTQVTPSDSTSLSRLWLKERGKLMFQIRRDANGDRRFSDEDGSQVIEVDLAHPGIGVPSLSIDTIKSLSSVLR